MSEVSDERRIRKLPVIGSQSQRDGIDRAVVLWMARHGHSDPITPETRGEVLAAIEACRDGRWMAAAEVREDDEPGRNRTASPTRRRAYTTRKPPTLKGL